MSGALEVAAIGMRAQQRALDAIASNVSNINTPAFKRSEMRFAELVSPVTGGGGASREAVAGVDLRILPALDRQGQLDATGNPLDIAIDGAGFIELMGPAGRTLLWRGGRLRTLEDGTLATSAGLALKAGIEVPAESTQLRIDRTGKVFATRLDGESEIGTIALVRPTEPDMIERLEGGIYALVDDGGAIEAAACEEGLGTIVQASLERSNVDLNNEMVALLISQRAYAANAQVVRVADEFLTLANNLRR